MLNKIVIIGTGLIGGSLGLSLREPRFARSVVGLERSPSALHLALQRGLIDEGSSSIESALQGADLVVLAAPVAQSAHLLRLIYPYLEINTVVTDVGSTKSDVIAAARLELHEKIDQFVPAHPIAGREINGPEGAIADLFVGKKAVLCPLPENSPQSLHRVKSMWQHAGAQLSELAPNQHDRIFAAVSHLPHVLAYALVDEVAAQEDAEQLFEFAASGFRDFTRIASSSPEMWSDICLANREAILTCLRAYQTRVATMIDLLEASNQAGLYDMLDRAQQARESWIAKAR